MKSAPDRIWAWEFMPEKQSEHMQGRWCADKDARETEYIRLDLHEAAVAAARAEGMREAWQIAHNRWADHAARADRLFEMDSEGAKKASYAASEKAEEANAIAALLFARAAP